MFSMQTYSFCDIDFRPIQTSLFHLNSGCKWDIMNQTHPLDDYLLGVYFKIFLESFEQRSLKNLEKYLNFHHIIMLWLLLKKLLKICHCQKKFKSIYKSFYCLKTLVTMFSKCFRLFFVHQIKFKKFKYIYQYIENNIMWKQFHLQFSIFV
jgi:hypothetical protein